MVICIQTRGLSFGKYTSRAPSLSDSTELFYLLTPDSSLSHLPSPPHPLPLPPISFPTPQMAPLSGHRMSWASPATWHSDASPSSIVHCRMHFGYNNRTHVERMARRVSNPRSRWYRRYPSVEKFTARFAPPQAYFAQVTQFLTTEGFNVAYEAVNRKYIAFDGTVAQFGRTFHMSFGMYSVSDLVVRSPKSEPSIPAHLLQGHKIQLLGLDHGWHVDLVTRKPRPRGKGSPYVAQEADAARVAFQDCQWSSASSYSSDPDLGGCGYRPQQVGGVWSQG